VSTHGILLLHSSATLFLAGVMWTVQLTIVPVIERDSPDTWPHHAGIYRRVFRLVFWPVVIVEGGSGLLVALQHPAGIPAWLHGVNLALLACAWLTMPLVLYVVRHHPLSRFDPEGFRRFARLNWIRVAVWTARCAVVLVMLQLAHAAARAG
jgi:hypothetical protein